MENKKAERWLKAAFLIGAVIDALALLPMLIPQLATTMWGLKGMREDYYFAMAMGASLMAGWTLLLLWAFVKPVERRIIALFTVVVIAGFAAAEIAAVADGAITFDKALPSLAMQCVLSTLFVTAFILSRKKAGASNAGA